MRSSISIWLAGSLLSAVAFAAPSYGGPGVTSANADLFSDYFELLSSKVGTAKSMLASPVCDLSKVSMPSCTPTLPPPSAGLTLKHVAVGRGTQNYTCGTNATAPPSPIGAMATLFNASCIAASYPDILNILPSVALQFDLDTSAQATLLPACLDVSGHHFFLNTSTAFFDLNTPAMQLGQVPCGKNNSSPAPHGAPLGQNNSGYGSVPWLKLLAKPGATGGLREVYRLDTAGGSPPATCENMPSAFQIQYSALYFFWAT